MKFASNNITTAFLTVALIFGLSCKENKTEAIKTEKITFDKEGELQIFKTDATTINLDVEFAETDYEVQTGLMYRESMTDKQGMLFIFPNVAMHSFYMKNTQFPLDIIFVDEHLKIASFQKNAQPLNETSLSSQVPIKYVLEINAGLSDQWNIAVGDSISYAKM